MQFLNALVTPRFSQPTIRREEGGTPNILGAIRCGLVFQLWDSIGGQEIQRREANITEKVLAAWGKNPNIKILGSTGIARIPVVAFMVEHTVPAGSIGSDGSGGEQQRRLLHWNYVSTLLSDLFGIQARGGCLCAGPYGTSTLFALRTQQGRCQRDAMLIYLARTGNIALVFSRALAIGNAAFLDSHLHCTLVLFVFDIFFNIFLS